MKMYIYKINYVTYQRYHQLSDLISEKQITVRVYIVQGMNLRPMDSSQYSDPYIQIQYGSHKVGYT